MSYFKRIAERTLKVDSGSLKPAITPDSIPESFEINNMRVGTPTRRISLSSTSGSVKKKPADEPRGAIDAKGSGEERLSENAGMDIATATASHRKQVTQAAAPYEKAAAPDQDMMSDNKQEEVSAEKEEKEGERKPHFSTPAAAEAPIAVHETTEVGRADYAASQIKQLERGRGVVVSRDNLRTEHHPKLRPTTGSDEKYATLTQPDETNITINIGRIEVRAVSPVETSRSPSPPRKEYYNYYSPPLSLDEYLKRRMEGKK